MDKYNALDNIEAAKKLREQLILEQQDLGASLSYEYATSQCDNCPLYPREPQSYSEQEFGIHYARTCCKEDEQWAEDHQDSFKAQEHIESLIQAISRYLGKELE